MATCVPLSLAVPSHAAPNISYLLGEIITVAAVECPPGSVSPEGQEFSIIENQPLFSLLGTAFGGDGVTTFKLPDLRGRSPINAGQEPGKAKYEVGQTGETETVSLEAVNTPSDSH